MSRLGLSLALGTRTRRPRTRFDRKRARLAAALAASAGRAHPHNQPAMADPPALRMNGAGGPGAPAAPDADLTRAVRYGEGTLAGVTRAEGGGEAAYFTSFRRFPVASVGASGGNVTATEDACTWRVTTRTDARRIAFRLLGGASKRYRFIVDGAYVASQETVMAEGGRQYAVLDFDDGAMREIACEGAFDAGIAGIHVAPGDVLAPPPPRAARILLLGDSVTRGTGAPRVGDSLTQRLGDRLGVEIWNASVSGTGYRADGGGSHLTLGARAAADIARMARFGPIDAIVVAAGLNDIGHAGLSRAFDDTFDAMREAAPDVPVLVVSPWNRAAPAPPSADELAFRDAMAQALEGRPGFAMRDPAGLEYSKADAVHPDAAGHATLAAWLEAEMRAVF